MEEAVEWMAGSRSGRTTGSSSRGSTRGREAHVRPGCSIATIAPFNPAWKQHAKGEHIHEVEKVDPRAFRLSEGSAVWRGTGAATEESRRRPARC